MSRTRSDELIFSPDPTGEDWSDAEELQREMERQYHNDRMANALYELIRGPRGGELRAFLKKMSDEARS